MIKQLRKYLKTKPETTVKHGAKHGRCKHLKAERKIRMGENRKEEEEMAQGSVGTIPTLEEEASEVI